MKHFPDNIHVFFLEKPLRYQGNNGRGIVFHFVISFLFFPMGSS